MALGRSLTKGLTRTRSARDEIDIDMDEEGVGIEFSKVSVPSASTLPLICMDGQLLNWQLGESFG